MPIRYVVVAPYFGRSCGMYSGLPPPHVIEDWKRRQEERTPAQPMQVPLQIPLLPKEPPKRDDADKKDPDVRGIVVIDLTARSLDAIL